MTINRQQRYQQRKRDAGFCIGCGKEKLYTKNHCAVCAKKANERNRRDYMRSQGIH